jgi:hypothetical protein
MLLFLDGHYLEVEVEEEEHNEGETQEERSELPCCTGYVESSCLHIAPSNSAEKAGHAVTGELGVRATVFHYRTGW